MKQEKVYRSIDNIRRFADAIGREWLNNRNLSNDDRSQLYALEQQLRAVANHAMKKTTILTKGA